MPPGYIAMLADYIDAAEKFVTCPSRDTIYGARCQDLDTKAVIVFQDTTPQDKAAVQKTCLGETAADRWARTTPLSG